MLGLGRVLMMVWCGSFVVFGVRGVILKVVIVK